MNGCSPHRTCSTTIAALLLVAAACTPSVDAQHAAPTATDTLNFLAPDRPVSRIVAPRWIGEDERDKFGEAARVIAFAGVEPGMTVADIGAGDGYYVVRLAPIVTAKGKVIGEDITPAYLALLRKRITSDRLQNVVAVAGTPDNPMLEPQSVDVAFMIHMYHEITRPFELLWNLSRAMKPAATLTIVDQDSPTDQHGTPPALLRCELELMGYQQTKINTLEDGAYVARFRAPDRAVAPTVVRVKLANGACKAGR